ncbi:MAG: hypothetical protein WCS99_07530 [Limisphaerales bacterium]
MKKPNAIPNNHAAAFIVGALTLFIPMMTYTSKGTGSLLDRTALLTLFGVTSLGGALTLAFYLGPGRRIQSLIAGLVGGFCSFGLTILYVKASGRAGLTSYELMLLLGLGFAPGLLIMFWLNRRQQRADHKQDRADEP